MTVCNAGGTPRLYVTTMGSRGRVLYSDNGTTFNQASTTGLKSSDRGYRPLVCFKDPGGKTLLITSPVAVQGDSDSSNNPIVLATDDPISGTWRPYSLSRFGDPDNNAIFSIGALDTNSDGYGDTALYAGVANHVSGSQIWKTSGCKRFPCVPTWTKIVDKGAGRPLSDDGFVQNAGVSHFVEHNGAMYAAFSDSAGEKITAELIRINPDDSFELIIGQPRLNVDLNPILNLSCTFTSIDGVGTNNDCPPLSGRGAGFGKKDGSYNDGTQYYFWHMLSYDPVLFPQGDSRLYVGTLEGFRVSGATPGFDLLATNDDGLNWVQVTTDGLGDTTQSGARTIVGSPFGMFIGGANWGTNDTAGCDVWLGTCDPALASPPISDPRAVLKSTMPGQVVFDGQRYIAYDDENYPGTGDGYVTVTLESRSYDPFCGDIVEQKWDKDDLTGSCGSLPGDLGTAKNLGPLTLCTPDALVGGVCGEFTPSSINGSEYAEYTFTLQVTDNDTNMVCKKVVVRASKNLPPSVNAETDPPAVFSQGKWSVSLVDFDGNGSQPLSLRGMGTDPEGLSPLTCTWSADAAVTFAGKTPPFEDADPGVLGTSYAATVPVSSSSVSYNIVLTSVDNLGNKTSLPVAVRTRSASSNSTGDSSPRCQGVSRTIAKNTILTVNPATDTVGPRCVDPEGQTLNYIVTQPSAGTGTTDGGSGLQYTPPADFLGTAAFTLQACDPGGNCSSVVGIRVDVQDAPPPPPGPPSAPATASAKVLTGRTVRVTWTDVANETRYEVQRCRSLFGGCSFSTIASNVAADTTFIDNTVTFPGTFRFRVRACNAKGCSAYTQAPDLAVP
jgi:hypothetical protein